MSHEAFDLVNRNAIAKGDVLRIAEVAGVMGGKRASDLIPLCHPLGLDSIIVECSAEPDLPGVRITASAVVTGRTGVEMEALTAIAVASLTVYDMVKGLDKGVSVERVELLEKSGGRSGTWTRGASGGAP